MTLTVANFISNFLATKGVKHVFALSGGASLHLIHSIEKTVGINLICCHHEQSCAMAADAYSRITGNIGVAMTTSGPGATNLITGIAGCYYDSIPAVFITGQVATFRMSNELQARQLGFQETPIIPMVNEIVKYAVQITDKYSIKYELEKAFTIAKSGRPGPVLIDIPEDIQREIVEESELPIFIDSSLKSKDKISEAEIELIIDKLNKSERPIVIGGWGLRLSDTTEEFLEFLELFSIPTALTWAAIDIMPADHILNIGPFGTHGTRYGNFAVQNADCIISLGCRLDTKATGSPPSSFAREAWICMVDIDQGELIKYEGKGLNINSKISCDLRSFLPMIIAKAKNSKITSRREKWSDKIREWKRNYQPIDESRKQNIQGINPYEIMALISDISREGSNIFLDTGCSLAWAMQAIKPKKGVRLFHDFNNTAMGWALPASIAGALASKSGQSICITGDGSIMLNLQELSTLFYHDLKIAIIIINNNGYSMIRQTQDQWQNSNYLGSSFEGGLAFPDFCQLAESFGIKSFSIDPGMDIEEIKKILTNNDWPILLDIKIDQKWQVTPQVKFGRPNEDAEPLLDRELFEREMIIKTTKQEKD